MVDELGERGRDERTRKRPGVARYVRVGATRGTVYPQRPLVVLLPGPSRRPSQRTGTIRKHGRFWAGACRQ